MRPSKRPENNEMITIDEIIFHFLIFNRYGAVWRLDSKNTPYKNSSYIFALFLSCRRLKMNCKIVRGSARGLTRYSNFDENKLMTSARYVGLAHQ